MPKRLFLSCLSIFVILFCVGFVQVPQAMAYSCDFSSVFPQANTPFTVSITNAMDSGGVNRLGRTAPLTGTLIVWNNSDHSFRNSVTVSINNGSTSGQLSAPFLPGTQVVFELKINSESESVCISSPVVLAANASLIPDGVSSGCCSSSSACQQWYGASSSCPTNSNGNNGACQSGYQCVGGDPNFLVQPGQSCSSIPAGEEYLRCATHVCIDGVCAQPCGGNASCLTNRYPTVSQSCDSTLCDCSAALSSFESPITQGSGGTLSATQCGIGSSAACTSLISSAIGTALVCHPERNSSCTSQHCALTSDATNHTVTIDTACLPEAGYQLQLSLGTSPDVFAQLPFSVDVNHAPVTLQTSSFPQLPAGYFETTLRVPGMCALPLSTDYFSVAPPGITPGVTQTPTGGPFQLCTQAGAGGSQATAACIACATSNGIWTGVGCIPYGDPAETVRAIITLGLGVAGGVVVIMSLAGGFLMTTSKGDPKRVDEAKSLITSAVAGIFFLIFSVSILSFIGVRILQLPGFG